jgi:hypothetical protein
VGAFAAGAGSSVVFRTSDVVEQPAKNTALPASTEQIHRAVRDTFREPMRAHTLPLDVTAAACAHPNSRPLMQAPSCKSSQSASATERDSDRVGNIGWFWHRGKSTLRHHGPLHLCFRRVAISGQRALHFRRWQFSHGHAAHFSREQHNSATVRHLNRSARVIGV